MENGNRWSDGVENPPMSVKLNDFNDCSDYFGWSIGGDGYNGEVLMYEMDTFFETLDIIDKNID